MLRARFARFSSAVSDASGTPWAFILACALVLAWVVGGFFIGFDSTLYQLVINTGTTIITFLMVFLIQAQQNRLDEALHAKLDELIRVNDRAHNDLIGIEKQDTASEHRQKG